MQYEHEMRRSGPESPKPGFFASRSKIVLIGFLAIAAFYLVTEHTAHLFGALPYLLLLACPLMHIFMHGGHRGHQGHGLRDQHVNNASDDQDDRRR